MGQLRLACVKNPQVRLMLCVSGREKTPMGAAWVLMVQAGRRHPQVCLLPCIAGL